MGESGITMLSTYVSRVTFRTMKTYKMTIENATVREPQNRKIICRHFRTALPTKPYKSMLGADLIGMEMGVDVTQPIGKQTANLIDEG